MPETDPVQAEIDRVLATKPCPDREVLNCIRFVLEQALVALDTLNPKPPR